MGRNVPDSDPNRPRSRCPQAARTPPSSSTVCPGIPCWRRHPGVVSNLTRREIDCGFGVRLYTGEPERYWIPRGIEPPAAVAFRALAVLRSRTDGDLEGTFDALSFTGGCLDPAKVYLTERLMLTYPLVCKDITR